MEEMTDMSHRHLREARSTWRDKQAERPSGRSKAGVLTSKERRELGAGSAGSTGKRSMIRWKDQRSVQGTRLWRSLQGLWLPF